MLSIIGKGTAMSQVIEAAGKLPPSGKLTFQEFLDWLDDKTHAEWVEGEVVFMSPVTDRHHDLKDFLAALLRHHAEARNLGLIRGEPFQMKIGAGLPSRCPDIFFIANRSRERLNRTFLDGPADLAVEILSRESVQRDRVEKFQEYARGGVREYWLIDPEARRAEFYFLEDGAYRAASLAEGGIFRSAVMTGLWLRVEWLWQEPLPSLLSILGEWGLV